MEVEEVGIVVDVFHLVVCVMEYLFRPGVVDSRQHLGYEGESWKHNVELQLTH